MNDLLKHRRVLVGCTPSMIEEEDDKDTEKPKSTAAIVTVPTSLQKRYLKTLQFTSLGTCLPYCTCHYSFQKYKNIGISEIVNRNRIETLFWPINLVAAVQVHTIRGAVLSFDIGEGRI